jgi:hypothetical protein
MNPDIEYSDDLDNLVSELETILEQLDDDDMGVSEEILTEIIDESFTLGYEAAVAEINGQGAAE